MLQSVLRQRIKSLKVLNPEIPGALPANKLVWLDILVELANGTRVDLEMQIRVSAELIPRVIYYTARNYVSQLGRGEEYGELKPSVTVLWVVSPLLKDLDEYHSVFELRERETHRLLSDKLELHVLQLSKMKQVSVPTGDDFERDAHLWGKFLSAKSLAYIESPTAKPLGAFNSRSSASY